MLVRSFVPVGIISLVLSFVSTSSAYEITLAQALRERDSSSPGRELRAATKTENLAKRHTNFFTTSEVELTYAERENLNNEPNFGATVNAQSHVPILLLEDFEHLAEYIVCQPGYIAVHLLPGVDRFAAEEALLSLEDGGLVITSHYGCNTRGERRLYSVAAVDLNDNGSVFMLETTEASWQTSFGAFKVQMYHTTACHAHRPHAEIRRRQDSDTPTSTNTNLPSSSIPEPTVTSTSEVNTLDLSTEGLINKNLLPENSSIQITCKNCSTSGSLDFSFVSFELAPDLDELGDGVQLGDFLDGGEATVVAHNLGARVELLTNITGSNQLDLPLPQIPLVFGISLSGIGSAGLLYAPRVHLDYTLNGSISFTYGFEIIVPDNSRLFLDMTDPTNSSLSGFGDTKVEPIPFQASVDVNSAIVNIHLRHQIEVGFHFHSGLFSASADVGVYLDLPKYRAEFTHMTDVDENCTALTTSQTENRELVERVLTDVYQIKPSVLWQAGFAGEAKFVGVGPDFDYQIKNGTISDLPLSCLNFNRTSGTYAEAAQVVAQEKKRSGAGHLRVTSATYWVAGLILVVSLLL